MKRPRFVYVPLFIAVLALGLAGSAGAWAHVNDSEAPGSVLVFPKFIRGTFNDAGVTGQAVHARTELEISVTCPKGAGAFCAALTPFDAQGHTVKLRAHWVCPGFTGTGPASPGTCTETNFDLETTVNGSLFFNPEGVTVNLLGVVTAQVFPNNATTTIPQAPCPEGYLIVWVVDQAGQAIKFDGLIGNGVIRDGQPAGAATISARAYNAIPIQAGEFLATGDPTDQTLSGVPGALDFDGTEYKMITGKIFGTVRYEDVVAMGGLVETHLTLLTLDVASNLSNPVTTVGLNFFTTGEDIVSTAASFVCWREQRLTEINSGLNDTVMGRKGLVESTSAEQQLDFFTRVPVTVLGIVETKEGILSAGVLVQFRDYVYSLYNDGEPVATTFAP